MRELIRKPLTWMIVAECLIVGSLVMVSWHFLSEPQPSPSYAVLVPGAPDQPASPAQQTGVPLRSPSPPARRLLPGLNVDPAFWGLRLSDLNRDEAAVEGIEWRLTRAAIDAVQRYVRSVVLPAIRQAESRA